MLPPAKKWKFLTLCKMKKIINKVEKGQKKMDIAEEYGIACSSLSTLLKNNFECTWEWYVCAFVVVDKAMFAWFTEQHANNVPLPGKALQHKAVDFPSILGHENFHANAGWG